YEPNTNYSSVQAASNNWWKCSSAESEREAACRNSSRLFLRKTASNGSQTVRMEMETSHTSLNRDLLFTGKYIPEDRSIGK
ncbi:MAG: hypothetical protein WCC94_12800, partial [Candidatus Bathyarchaeia archaeon]